MKIRTKIVGTVISLTLLLAMIVGLQQVGFATLSTYDNSSPIAMSVVDASSHNRDTDTQDADQDDSDDEQGSNLVLVVVSVALAAIAVGAFVFAIISRKRVALVERGDKYKFDNDKL